MRFKCNKRYNPASAPGFTDNAIQNKILNLMLLNKLENNNFVTVVIIFIEAHYFLNHIYYYLL